MSSDRQQSYVSSEQYTHLLLQNALVKKIESEIVEKSTRNRRQNIALLARYELAKTKNSNIKKLYNLKHGNL